MCTYIVEKAAIAGSAKGGRGWMRVASATVYLPTRTSGGKARPTKAS